MRKLLIYLIMGLILISAVRAFNVSVWDTGDHCENIAYGSTGGNFSLDLSALINATGNVSIRLNGSYIPDISYMDLNLNNVSHLCTNPRDSYNQCSGSLFNDINSAFQDFDLSTYATCAGDCHIWLNFTNNLTNATGQKIYFNWTVSGLSTTSEHITIYCWDFVAGSFVWVAQKNGGTSYVDMWQNETPEHCWENSPVIFYDVNVNGNTNMHLKDFWISHKNYTVNLSVSSINNINSNNMTHLCTVAGSFAACSGAEFVDVNSVFQDKDVSTYAYQTIANTHIWLNFTNNLTNTSGEKIFFNWTITNLGAGGSHATIYCWDYVGGNLVLIAQKNGGTSYVDMWQNETPEHCWKDQSIIFYDVNINQGVSTIKMRDFWIYNNATIWITKTTYPSNLTIYADNVISYFKPNAFDSVLNISFILNNSRAVIIPFDFLSNNTGILEVCLNNFVYNNSLNITIFDDDSGNLITDLIDIRMSNNLTTLNVTTSTGKHIFNDSFNGIYEVKLSGSSYQERKYYVTFSTGASQILFAYLSKGNESVTFTIKDDDSGMNLEGAGVIMQKEIGGVWTAINTKSSDITGRVQFNFVAGIKYRFIVSLPGYQLKTFILDPILFSTYNVRLTKSGAYSQDIDYYGILAIHSPHEFINNVQNNLTFIFSSADGILVSYGYNVSYPNGTILVVAGAGNNAQGESFTTSINISGATPSSRVIIQYHYTSTLGGVREFRIPYIIQQNQINKGTWLFNKREDYGMGLLERVLIVVVTTIVVAGFITLVAGAEAGMGIGLVVLGVLSWMLAINIWLILISELVGLLVIARRSSD